MGGLDIRLHRKRMEQLDAHGHDLEYNFKDPEHPLQLVFVCAMWLTGFDFAERLQEIIDNYNSGSSSVDDSYAQLLEEMASLKEEESRHIRKGLTEDELEIYDLLCKENMSQAEEKKVRIAAKELLKRLTEEKPKVLVQDWYKDSQTRLAVRDEVGAVLDEHLPEESYDKDIFLLKRDRVFELTLDLAINHQRWAA